MQSDSDMNTEVNKRTPCGRNTRKKMSGVLYDKKVPPHVKGQIHKTIVQPVMMYGLETVPMNSSHVNKLEVTAMKRCRWTCGQTLIDPVRYVDIREILKVEHLTERCRNARWRWFGHVNRTNNRSEEILWKWDQVGEESEEDRSRDGWTVSTGT